MRAISPSQRQKQLELSTESIRSFLAKLSNCLTQKCADIDIDQVLSPGEEANEMLETSPVRGAATNVEMKTSPRAQQTGPFKRKMKKLAKMN